MSVVKLDIKEIRSLYWKEKLNIKEIAERLSTSFWSVYRFMHKNDIPRRFPSESNYIVNKDKPQFRLKENFSFSDEKLKVAGVMLYWAEGTLKGSTVDFANSNTEMIKIFLKFLREICGIKNERLRVYLYAYTYQNIDKVKEYWSRITGVPKRQFTKPYIRKGNLNLSQRKLPYGLVHIRYNDKRLLELITSWIEEYIRWAGTQVAKGGRLSKGSVLPKGEMEK